MQEIRKPENTNFLQFTNDRPGGQTASGGLNIRNMEPGFLRPTRWRTHEYLLVTILTAAAVVRFIWPIFNNSPEHLNEGWGRGFAEAHLSFDYYRDVLLPHVSFLLAVYGCYWWATGYIIPTFMRSLLPAAPGTSRMAIAPGKAIWLLLNFFLLTISLGVAFGSAYSYMDAPAVVNEHLTNAMIIGIGLRHANDLVLGYFAYAITRELVIRRMQDNPVRNTLLIQLTDKLSTFFLVYFSAGAILANFDVLPSDPSVNIFIFLLVPPAILTTYTNFYWVFPLKGRGNLLHGWTGQTRRRLLISTLLWSVPFIYYGVPDSHALPPALTSAWMLQIAITTPVSWYLFLRRKDKILEVQGLQTALGQSEADLQFLRSQINPHFLFNVLNTLYGTALQEQASRTAAGVQRLGDMMRFMLHENHLQYIPMDREVEYLKNYIALQELRTESSDSIRIRTDIDETFPDLRIAPMLFIPFVENGFKHGISLREPSWIELRLKYEGDRINFEMSNSIHTRKGDDPEKTRSGIGLKNVLHRLKLLYPDRHEFHMHQDDKEFFVQLSIQP